MGMFGPVYTELKMNGGFFGKMKKTVKKLWGGISIILDWVKGAKFVNLCAVFININFILLTNGMCGMEFLVCTVYSGESSTGQ